MIQRSSLRHPRPRDPARNKRSKQRSVCSCPPKPGLEPGMRLPHSHSGAHTLTPPPRLHQRPRIHATWPISCCLNADRQTVSERERARESERRKSQTDGQRHIQTDINRHALTRARIHPPQRTHERTTAHAHTHASERTSTRPPRLGGRGTRSATTRFPAISEDS